MMEVVRRVSQPSRPSSTLMGAHADLAGEASPVPSWVVPSKAGVVTSTTTHTTAYNTYTTDQQPTMQAVGEPFHSYHPETTTQQTYSTDHVQTGGWTTSGATTGGKQTYLERGPDGKYTTKTVYTEEYMAGNAATERNYQLQQETGNTQHARLIGNTGGYVVSSTTTGEAQAHMTHQNQYEQITSGATGINQDMSSTGGYTVTTTGEVRKESRVVGREYGAQRLVSETRRVDETRQSVISERYVEHEIRIPKKIIREEVIEKVIVIPETVRHEEVVDDIQVVREKIIEVSKPTIVEKVVEIPEIEYIERIVEVPERVVQERLIKKDVVEVRERINEIIKPVIKQIPRIVPEISYRDIPREKVVEKIEWVDRVVVVPKTVPQYVEKPVAREVVVEKAVDIDVKIPVPVEAEVIHEYHLPQIKPRYTKATYPVYLPRFIEVPVATELLREDLKLKSTAYVGQIGALTNSAASLCEIENLAAQIMKSGDISSQTTVDVQDAVMRAWQSNALQIRAGTEDQQLQHAIPVSTTLAIAASEQPTYVVSARSPLHADVASKGASKKSKKSNKSVEKKN